jgi:hypothetical protein
VTPSDFPYLSLTGFAKSGNSPIRLGLLQAIARFQSSLNVFLNCPKQFSIKAKKTFSVNYESSFAPLRKDARQPSLTFSIPSLPPF